jgi:predicted nucleic acid-binding protein
VRVVDASVYATALTDQGSDGERVRGRLRTVRVAVPEHAAVEVASVIRGRVLGGALDVDAARLAIEDLAVAPVRRYDTRPLLSRIWELRDNLTVYDAGYVALAEALDCPLVTADRRLAHAPGVRCEVELV